MICLAFSEHVGPKHLHTILGKTILAPDRLGFRLKGKGGYHLGSASRIREELPAVSDGSLPVSVCHLSRLQVRCQSSPPFACGRRCRDAVASRIANCQVKASQRSLHCLISQSVQAAVAGDQNTWKACFTSGIGMAVVWNEPSGARLPGRFARKVRSITTATATTWKGSRYQ